MPQARRLHARLLLRWGLRPQLHLLKLGGRRQRLRAWGPCGWPGPARMLPMVIQRSISLWLACTH